MHGNYEKKVVLENEVKTLTDFENSHKSGTAACFNCRAACKSTIRLSQGQYASVKCQSFFNFMFALKINDVHFSVCCFRLCEDYGLDRRNDTIHQRFFERSPDRAEPVIDRGRFDEMISRFYRLRGWDDNGIPSAAELDRLGLAEIRLKLEQRGLL